ncbi:acyltransferase [Pseudomonas glycinae]|uniref:acyltransferase family protein n=1 Tax=Pseudomonas glycinae TaxID=1785145 RepID=UPI0018D927FC|nr:acyltransferase [Pseudomonas glycinae]MBH3405683.1 acyltransferase [Pseudomonas glycinae]
MPSPVDRSGAIPALTGLRFVAALMVFFSHYPIAGLSEIPTRIMMSGYSGVTFFFVLSGFIISYNYLNKFTSSALKNTPAYLWARFSRVYPLYILTMLFVWLQKGAIEPISIYIFAAQAWHPDVYVIGGLNGPAWSISVEAFLYLCFPLLIPIFSRIGILRPGPRMITATIIIIAVQLSLAAYLAMPPRDTLATSDPDSAHRWLYNFPLPRVLDFSLGIIAAAFYIKNKSNIINSAQWNYICLASLAAITMLMASKEHFFSSYSWSASYAGLFALLILSIAESQKSFLSKALSTKSMILLGEASFAFYLIHVIALPMFELGTERSFPTAIAFNLIFLGLVTTMSIGLHLSVEKPCRQFLLGLIHRNNGRQPLSNSDKSGSYSDK